MKEHTLLLWLWMMIPIAFSAGPANITMAAFGARFGFSRTLPFILGVNTIVLVQSLLVGFGLYGLIESYPRVFKIIQIAGVTYLLYLAYKFYRSTSTESKQTDKLPTYRDGIILQAFNIKGFVMSTIMFSQFLNNNENEHFAQVFILSFGLLFLTTLAMFSWTWGGSWLLTKVASKSSAKFQGYVFGSMLVFVAIWMLF